MTPQLSGDTMKICIYANNRIFARHDGGYNAITARENSRLPADDCWYIKMIVDF
jgi:hypothetical protein